MKLGQIELKCPTGRELIVALLHRAGFITLTYPCCCITLLLFLIQHLFNQEKETCQD